MPERSANISTHDPFGSLLGYAPGGIAIYSSDYHTADEKEYPDDVLALAVELLKILSTAARSPFRRV